MQPIGLVPNTALDTQCETLVPMNGHDEVRAGREVPWRRQVGSGGVQAGLATFKPCLGMESKVHSWSWRLCSSKCGFQTWPAERSSQKQELASGVGGGG